MQKHLRKVVDRQAEPVPVQIALPLLETLVDAEQAFFGLCVDAGREVLWALMEEDRKALCGPKGQHDPERRASRGGSTQSPVTLGGRRIPIQRLRARSVEGEELALPSYRWAADRDPLDQRTLEAIAVGVSTRHYARSLEALRSGEPERAISASAVSRRFVALSEQQLREWLAQPLEALDLRIVMIDGKVFQEHCVLIALGIAADGKKHVLSVQEGTTENARVAKALLRDLIGRGLRSDRALLFVIDGSKALRKAIRETFGRLGVVHRCHEHKRRNVLGHLPGHLHASVGRALRQAWDATDAPLAQRQLERLARSLEGEHPGAAASLREGLEETLTLQRLGLQGALYRTLRTANPIENLNGLVSSYTRNVKRWRDGRMILRWVSAGLLEAQKHFRRIVGYKDLPKLLHALDAIANSREKKVA